MTEAEMDRLVAGSRTKSDKIRVLNNAGVDRAAIARYLGIRYQHVYNVLHRDGAIKPAGGATVREAPVPVPAEVWQLKMGAGGLVELPAAFVEAEGLAAGDVLVCRRDADGLRIMSRAAATGLLHQIARERMPEETALLEALIGKADSDRIR